MEYDLHLESAEGVAVEPLFSPSVAEAYDACRTRLDQRPGVTAVHLHLGGRRLHTLRARSRGPA